MTTRRRRAAARRTPELRVIPLGGLGEFGLNCMVIECGEDLLVIDTGLLFPEAELLGVDFVIPDFSYLFERARAVRGILLTHGHEDHIGALPYLLDRVAAPVYGTALTLGLVEERLRERGLKLPPRSRAIQPGQEATFGSLAVRFLQVTHSIPGALAIAIDTPAGSILHTGDFKLDPTPVDGRGFDFQGIQEAGRRGLLALFSDSTNAERPGYTRSEAEVGAALEPVLQRAPHRLLITTFASHIHRIQQVLNLAARHRRRLGFVGRSLHQNLRVASSLGYLEIPPRTVCEARELSGGAEDRAVLMVTGSQGEPMSALARIALDQHREVHLRKGDLVILSAREIPGNERAISRMVDHIFRRGAEVVLDPERRLHTSGHASQEELKLLWQMCRPRHFVPIHGDYHHLVRHADLVAACGQPRPGILLAVNGDVIAFRDGRGRIDGRVPAGRVFIDAGLERVEELVVRDRQHLSEDGVLMVVAAIDRQTGGLLGDPEVVSRGLSVPVDLEEVYRQAARILRETVAGSSPEERADWGVIRAKIQAALKRFCRKQLKRHPMILPVIMEV
ncbi:MAG: ribonuclease J [Acidobacteria bacterium]|nr:ribonuclease J [Acidobacteriota bacterium]